MPYAFNYKRELRRTALTAIRKAMDREMKMDPMAFHAGFTQDGAARVLDAMDEAITEFNLEHLTAADR